MPRNPPLLPRRAVIGGATALAAALVAGCTSSGDSGRSGTRTPAPRQSHKTDPDVRVAATVLEHERALLERVTAVARHHPRIAATLATTRAGHLAHVALLTKAVPNNTPVHSPSRKTATNGVPSQPGAALTALSAAERRLGDAVAHSSLAAQSGPFARVLASMAAAASQQSVRLAAAAAERR